MYFPNINCTSFYKGKCLHQAAPRSLFGAAMCIIEIKSSDPRVVFGCALKTPYLRPTSPPPGPKLRDSTER